MKPLRLSYLFHAFTWKKKSWLTLTYTDISYVCFVKYTDWLLHKFIDNGKWIVRSAILDK